MGNMSIANSGGEHLQQKVCVCVCVCALSVCVCCDSRGQLLPKLLPWYFPTERGLISERARGVLENETNNGSWQRS